MITKLQLEIDSTVHKFLKEHAKRDGLSVEGLIIRLIERYRRDVDAPGVVTRLIRDNAQGFMGRISPNGRYISYVNWATSGNLAIYDLETGESKDVTDEANMDRDKQCAYSSVWSPDSKQIAYNWSKEQHGKWGAELRIVGIDGTEPRVICSFPAGSGVLGLRTWSRDGKHILALRCKKTDEIYNHKIVLVSVADGSIRVLKSLDVRQWYFSNRMSLSPDGRYVVYDWPQSEGSPDRDIFLLATDGSHEMALVEHPAHDFAPLWTPDGDHIVFASDRSGSVGIWVLEVADGKPKGSPQLIKKNLSGMYPFGVTQDGSYYYGFMSSDSDIYLATLDPETSEVATPPEKAVQSFEGFNHWPAFSPNGRNLAYISQRPRGSGYFRILVIRSLETDEERELSPENIKIAHHTCWSPDGRSILISTFASTTLGPDIYQIDIGTDAATPVVLSDEQGNIVHRRFALSPDGNRIFFMRWVDGVEVIRICDLEAEREWQPDFQLACAEGYTKAMALSPDGQQLALVVSCDNELSLQIAPSSGGDAREVLRLRKLGRPVWTSDGCHLLFFGNLKDEATGLWRIPVEGGEPQNLGLTMELAGGLSLHPDGHRIVFTAPGSGHGAEVWAMENFLP